MRSILRLLLGFTLFACSQADGSLEIRILENGESTPARVEIYDSAGEPRIPTDALTLSFECFQAPPPDWLRAHVTSQEIANPYTATTQFYTAGHTALDLPAGTYRIRVHKGSEFRVAAREIEIAPGQHESIDISLERWVNPAAEGWFGADDHIHISRYRSDLNPNVLTWMRAEGLAVANLLTMGTADQFTVTPQYAYGDAGVYRGGGTMLLPGQEHPRTHFLGHTITLAAQAPIDLRDAYILFEAFWKQSEQLDGVSGFAHFGQGPANDGLAISAPGGRIAFVEVLQIEWGHYEVWYELLNLGFRIAPSAGTDFPCAPSIPGRERVYVKAETPLTRATFADGIRRGRAFVTNGPILSLEANGQPMGAQLHLSGPGPITLVGEVRFEPEREDIHTIEVVLGGEVVPARTRVASPGVVEVRAEVEVSHTSWVALRVRGSKLDEAPFSLFEIPDWAQRLGDQVASGWSFEGRDEELGMLSLRPSAAHTGAIYVDVPGTHNPQASELASKWIARLDDIEARLDDSRIAEIPIADWFPYSDGVGEAHLRLHRPALLDAITTARDHYRTLIEADPRKGE